MTNANHSPLPGTMLPAANGCSFDLLKGIRVLDLTSSVAGPYAALMLGDMGADVIKVERHGGDDARAWGPPFLHGESLWFLSVNRNKQSLRLDYSQPEGLEVLHALVRTADVVVLNVAGRVAKKLGLDYASLKACNSKLVYVSITGFGIDGERADWPCYDLIAEGYSGVMDLTGEITGDAQKVGTPAADMLAGQDAAFAALAALFKRHTNGEGALIDIALVDSMTRFLMCRIVPYLGSGELPRRSGGKDSVIAIYQSFQTADAPITLALGNDNIWGRFWEALGRPEMIGDVRYGSNAQRRECRREIVAIIQDILVTQPREHWLSLFRQARIPAGPINRIDEVVNDAAMRERGVFYNVSRHGSAIPQVGTAIRIDGQANYPRLPPPGLGEHTEELLKTLLGYDESRLAGLRQRAVII